MKKLLTGVKKCAIIIYIESNMTEVKIMLTSSEFAGKSVIKREGALSEVRIDQECVSSMFGDMIFDADGSALRIVNNTETHMIYVAVTEFGVVDNVMFQGVLIFLHGGMLIELSAGAMFLKSGENVFCIDADGNTYVPTPDVLDTIYWRTTEDARKCCTSYVKARYNDPPKKELIKYVDNIGFDVSVKGDLGRGDISGYLSIKFNDLIDLSNGTVEFLDYDIVREDEMYEQEIDTDLYAEGLYPDEEEGEDDYLYADDAEVMSDRDDSMDKSTESGKNPLLPK